MLPILRRAAVDSHNLTVTDHGLARTCRRVRAGRLPDGCGPLQRQGMMTSTPLAPAPSDPPEPFTGQLRLAVAAYLARFKGSSREHTESRSEEHTSELQSHVNL